jgi:hypothetical protein
MVPMPASDLLNVPSTTAGDAKERGTGRAHTLELAQFCVECDFEGYSIRS